MGVYHFMGLGRSVGAITAPLSYLAARFKRDHDSDWAFFEGSGEMGQPREQKRGDIQGLVLFTTPEIRTGKVGAGAEPYMLNALGFTSGQKIAGQTVQQALKGLLPDILKDFTQTSRDPTYPIQRGSVEMYWCDVERNDPTLTFERVAAVLSAVKSAGGLGKEVWVNLTGGANIINAALELAVSLLGVSARMYYILTDHVMCVRCPIPKDVMGTAQDTFWVDLPVIYFDFNEQHRLLLEEVVTAPTATLSVDNLYSRLQGMPGFGPLAGETIEDRLKTFNRLFLLPLLAQRLIVRDGDTIQSGLGWPLLERYYKAARRAGQEVRALHQLTEQESWFFREDVYIK